MRIEIDTVTLATILRSKTLSKILVRILDTYEYMYYSVFNEVDNPFTFSMENLRKSLGYKNKSTVSRGLKALTELGVFDMKTTNQGTVISFNPEQIRRV